MGGVSNPPVAANPNLAIWNAAQIQGFDVAETAPNDGDVYVWRAANNRFEPAPNGLAGSVQWSNIQGDKNYGDLVGKPNLDNFITAFDLAGLATEQALILLAQSIPDTSQFLTEVEISDVDGLQDALDTNASVGSAVAQINGTWSTNSTSYIQLGGANFKVSITANAGDKILIFPPSVSMSGSAVFFRLQRDGVDILLGDAAPPREQVTWGHCYGGSTNDGPGVYGMLPIGPPVVDTAPTTGTFEYSIAVKNISATVYLGRSWWDAANQYPRPISQLIAINLKQ